MIEAHLSLRYLTMPYLYMYDAFYAKDYRFYYGTLIDESYFMVQNYKDR